MANDGSDHLFQARYDEDPFEGFTDDEVADVQEVASNMDALVPILLNGMEYSGPCDEDKEDQDDYDNPESPAH